MKKVILLSLFVLSSFRTIGSGGLETMIQIIEEKNMKYESVLKMLKLEGAKEFYLSSKKYKNYLKKWSRCQKGVRGELNDGVLDCYFCLSTLLEKKLIKQKRHKRAKWELDKACLKLKKQKLFNSKRFYSRICQF